MSKNSTGRPVKRLVYGDAVEADIFITIEIGSGHVFKGLEADALADHLAGEAMKSIAAQPRGITCPLAKTETKVLRR